MDEWTWKPAFVIDLDSEPAPDTCSVTTLVLFDDAEERMVLECTRGVHSDRFHRTILTADIGPVKVVWEDGIVEDNSRIG